MAETPVYFFGDTNGMCNKPSGDTTVGINRQKVPYP